MHIQPLQAKMPEKVGTAVLPVRDSTEGASPQRMEHDPMGIKIIAAVGPLAILGRRVETEFETTVGFLSLP